MKLKSPLLICLFFLQSFSLHAQDFIVYSLQLMEKNATETVALISLSEIYPLNEHPDSLAIPDSEEEEFQEDSAAKRFEEAKYIKLDSIYRDRFFTGTKVSITDSVFIYDYADDILRSFAIKNLNTVACLNIYAGTDDIPFSQYDYMIGFEIDKKLLKGFDAYYMNSLVYIGKANPFVRAQMKPVVWKKMEPQDFPARAISIEDTARLRFCVKGAVYKYERDGLQFFVQDYLITEILSARRLLVIDLKTKETVCERIYYDHEGASPAPLNFMQPEYNDMINQWSGKLFKNKAPVIFGFEYYSFGCPGITFLNKTDGDIYIACDNRH